MPLAVELNHNPSVESLTAVIMGPTDTCRLCTYPWPNRSAVSIKTKRGRQELVCEYCVAAITDMVVTGAKYLKKKAVQDG